MAMFRQSRELLQTSLEYEALQRVTKQVPSVIDAVQLAMQYVSERDLNVESFVVSKLRSLDKFAAQRITESLFNLWTPPDESPWVGDGSSLRVYSQVGKAVEVMTSIVRDGSSFQSIRESSFQSIRESCSEFFSRQTIRMAKEDLVASSAEHAAAALIGRNLAPPYVAGVLWAPWVWAVGFNSVPKIVKSGSWGKEIEPMFLGSEIEFHTDVLPSTPDRHGRAAWTSQGILISAQEFPTVLVRFSNISAFASSEQHRAFAFEITNGGLIVATARDDRELHRWVQAFRILPAQERQLVRANDAPTESRLRIRWSLI
jgi:hypothetical protein